MMEKPIAKADRPAKWWGKNDGELQLVVRNVETYHEVATYRLKAPNILFVLGGFALLVAMLISALIFFTPLREFAPGYGDVVQRGEVMELRTTLAELTALVEGQEYYIENMRRTLLGEAITADSILEDRSAAVPLDEEPLPPSEAEIKLRREMEAERSLPGSTRVSTLPATGNETSSLAQAFLVAPVNGEVSAGFNLFKEHLGVDVLAPRNTAIKATRAGVVFMAEFTNNYGNVIGLQHDNNLISFYKHNSQLLKNVGDRVKAGEAIAIIGGTGTESTGPHLHFELWYGGRAVDPGEYVSF